MRVSDKLIKYIIISVLMFTILGLGYALISGKKQDKSFLEGSTMYFQSTDLMNSQNYVDALPILIKLESKYPNSSAIQHQLGIALAGNGNYSLAAKKMDKVIELNPYESEEPVFMLQYGQILYLAERSEDALLVLQRCGNLTTPEDIPDYHEQVTVLSEQILAEL